MAVLFEASEQGVDRVSKTNGHAPSPGPPSPINSVFVLKEKGHFYYEDRPHPTLPSEDHVIVKVCCTGICGSDVSERKDLSLRFFYPPSWLITSHSSGSLLDTRRDR